jgi:hypothetical protein
MTKKIVIPCFVGGAVSPTEFFIGSPAEGSDPITFQTKWLQQVKKGAVPPEIMKAILDIYKLAQETNVNFEELCYNAFNEK